jgi:hypothetical protein
MKFLKISLQLIIACFLIFSTNSNASPKLPPGIAWDELPKYTVEFGNGKIQMIVPTAFVQIPGGDPNELAFEYERKHKIIFKIEHVGENIESEKIWIRKKAEEDANEKLKHSVQERPDGKLTYLKNHHATASIESGYIKTHSFYGSLDGLSISITLYIPESEIPARAKELTPENQALYMIISGTKPLLLMLSYCQDFLGDMKVIK